MDIDIDRNIGIKQEPTVNGQTKFQLSNNCRLLTLLCKLSTCLEIFSLTLGIKVAFLTGENPSLDL